MQVKKKKLIECTGNKTGILKKMLQNMNILARKHAGKESFM